MSGYQRRPELLLLIKQLNEAIEHTKTLPAELRSKQLLDDLVEKKFMLVGYLGQVTIDEVDGFVKTEILGEENLDEPLS